MWLYRLLAVVGIQPAIHVVDVTATGLIVQQKASGGPSKSGSDAASALSLLPRGLTQQEVKVAAEDKDTYCYYYLLKVGVHYCVHCSHAPLVQPSKWLYIGISSLSVISLLLLLLPISFFLMVSRHILT